MIKRPIQEKDITIVNIYASNIEAPQYVKQILTEVKGKIDTNKNNSGGHEHPTYINGQIIKTV